MKNMKLLDETQLDDRTTMKTFEHQIADKPVWIHLTQRKQFNGTVSISTCISDPPSDDKIGRKSKKPEN